MNVFQWYQVGAWMDDGVTFSSTPKEPEPVLERGRRPHLKAFQLTVAVAVLAAGVTLFPVGSSHTSVPTTTTQASRRDDDDSVNSQAWSRVLQLLRAAPVLDENDADDEPPFFDLDA